MIKETLLVAFGGAIGSACRYLLSVVTIGAGYFIPLGTLTVNIVGSLLIGALLALTNGGNWHHFCIVGFCGGFTTFSTFSAEMITMLKTENYSNALIYALLSVFMCVASVAFGFWAVKQVR